MRNDTFSKSVKNRGFSQNSKGGDEGKFFKNGQFFGQTLEA